MKSRDQTSVLLSLVPTASSSHRSKSVSRAVGPGSQWGRGAITSQQHFDMNRSKKFISTTIYLLVLTAFFILQELEAKLEDMLQEKVPTTDEEFEV